MVIKAGDLVIVMRNHCSDVGVGHIYRVLETWPDMPCKCCRCGAILRNMPTATLDAPEQKNNGMPQAWLKRIPPIDELEHEILIQSINENQRILNDLEQCLVDAGIAEPKVLAD